MNTDPRVISFARSKGFLHIHTTFSNFFITPQGITLFVVIGLFGAFFIKFTPFDFWLVWAIFTITIIIVLFRSRKKIRMITYIRMKQRYQEEITKQNGGLKTE